MSLLMDALRKAEADKKQADATDKDATAAPAASEKDLRAYAETHRFDRTNDRRSDSSPSINVKFADLGAAVADRSPGAELELEPLVPRKTSGKPRSSDGTGNATTIPSMRELESQLGSSFDESSSPRLPKTDTPAAAFGAAAPTDNDARRDSGITETVATAYTVFQAGSSGPSRRVLMFGIAVTAFIGSILLAAGFYYLQHAPTTLTLPSPSVALDVETSPPKELPVITVEETQHFASDEPARIETATIDDTLTVDVVPAAAAPATTSEPANEIASVMPGDASSGTDDARVPGDSGNVPALPQATDRAPLTPEVDVGFREVRIARSDPARTTEPLLNEAYVAYVAGDYAAAKRMYEAVLAERPQRRDALLGLAALHLRDGDVASAHRLYQQVLKRDPDNPTALAALFTLEGGAGDDMTESRLKLLLDGGVDVGYVYFSLGNLYARNTRWADAQQAYFEALRNYPQNPDYNYNLAVSLDRIGQHEAALKYYEAAVSLSDAAPAGFDPALALARIHAIAGDSGK